MTSYKKMLLQVPCLGHSCLFCSLLVKSFNGIVFLFFAEASDIMKSIGEAIQFLHAVNIAHRDVKVCAIALY